MEPAEQTERAPSKLLVRDIHVARPLLEARTRGLTKASEKIVQSLQHRRQSLAEKSTSATPLGPVCAKHVGLLAQGSG